jgi:hypothetical protein
MNEELEKDFELSVVASSEVLSQYSSEKNHVKLRISDLQVEI